MLSVGQGNIQVRAHTVISDINENRVLECVVQTLTSNFLYGVFVDLFARATGSFWPTRTQRWMFVINSLTFVLSTIKEVTLVASTVIYIHSETSRSQKHSLGAGLPSFHSFLTNPSPNNIFSWIGCLEPTISNGIVIWRIYILFRHTKWLAAVLCVVLLGSAGSLLAFLVLVVKGADPSHNKTLKLYLIGMGLSLSTNISATIAISHVYWSHRKHLANFSKKTRPSQVEQILVLLVESGVVLTVTQALYPTLVIHLANGYRTPDIMFSLDGSPVTIASSRHATALNFSPPEHVEHGALQIGIPKSPPHVRTDSVRTAKIRTDSVWTPYTVRTESIQSARSPHGLGFGSHFIMKNYHTYK
ncbi:hypothetical protein BDZ94DRAFT_1241109 [Collybia nuda]|uniref:Uncharacterized protein n=1 Tax=Collybia nuda TaxID=64659 RepID=A0A9P5XWR8_9AGAR|nr:hypothetical protein BDZ94DRAFT_1241109 [Collybia nuda]